MASIIDAFKANVKGKKRDKSYDDNHRIKEPPTIIGPYILGKKLGEGTFGVVRLATHSVTGERVAIKILDKARIIEPKDKMRVEREIQILKSLRHNNIIQLYSVIQTESSIYIAMEYASGKELFNYIVAKKRLPEVEACRFYQQIISGVEYIHQLRISHRDLKPENLLLDDKKNIKMVDFGLSNMYQNGQLLSSACGSPCYAAPEMINGLKYKGRMVDIWSSGIILFAMICGYLPFEDKNHDVLYDKITCGSYVIPNYVSEQAKDLIKGILNIDPNKRFDIEQIRSHPWFNLIVPSVNLNEGLLMNTHIIPIDEEIIESMMELGYNKEKARSNIITNRHNHITTTYYLLLKIKINKGESSISDLASNEFSEHVKNPENLLSKYNYDYSLIVQERAFSKKKLEEKTSRKSLLNETISEDSDEGNKANEDKEEKVDIQLTQGIKVNKKKMNPIKHYNSLKDASTSISLDNQKTISSKPAKSNVSSCENITKKINIALHSKRDLNTSIIKQEDHLKKNCQLIPIPTALVTYKKITTSTNSKIQEKPKQNHNNISLKSARMSFTQPPSYLQTEASKSSRASNKQIKIVKKIIKENPNKSQVCSSNLNTSSIVAPIITEIETYSSRPVTDQSTLSNNSNRKITGKNPKKYIDKRRQGNNFFDTTMSFEKDYDSRNMTFDKNHMKALILEEQSKVKVPKIRMFPYHTNNSLKKVLSTDKLKLNLKCFDVIKEEEEKENKVMKKPSVITQRHHKLNSTSPHNGVIKKMNPVNLKKPSSKQIRNQQIAMIGPCTSRKETMKKNIDLEKRLNETCLSKRSKYHNELILIHIEGEHNKTSSKIRSMKYTSEKEKENHNTVNIITNNFTLDKKPQPNPITTNPPINDEVRRELNKNKKRNSKLKQPDEFTHNNPNTHITKEIITNHNHHSSISSSINTTNSNMNTNGNLYINTAATSKYIMTEVSKLAQNKIITPKPSKVLPKNTSLIKSDPKKASEEIRISKDPIVSFLTLKPPQVLREEMMKILFDNKIFFKTSENYVYKFLCEKDSIKFQIEIKRSSDTKFYVVAFKKLEGNIGEYRDITNIFFSQMI